MAPTAPASSMAATRIRAMMSSPVITFTEDTTLEEVARSLLAHRIGGAPVVDAAGRLVGIVTESDFVGKERGVPFSTFRAPHVFGQWFTRGDLERLHNAARQLKARDVMSQPVVTISDDATVADAVLLMLRRGLRRLPVVRDGALIGIVTRHDALRLMAGLAANGGNAEAT